MLSKREHLFVCRQIASALDYLHDLVCSLLAGRLGTRVSESATRQWLCRSCRVFLYISCG